MKEECAGPSLFEDLDFPTTDSSLFSDSSTPIAQLHGEITWRRPQVDYLGWVVRKGKIPAHVDINASGRWQSFAGLSPQPGSDFP